MCQGIARCVLIVSNILFLIFGVLCLAIGIWVKVDKTHVVALFRISSEKIDTGSYDVPSLLESGAYILIAVGALVFVISVFGFCGAIRKSRCCLLIYGALVGIILVIQVAAGIAAGVFKGQFDSHAAAFLNNTLPDMYKGPFNDKDVVSLALDSLQASQKCCGLNGPDDFSNWQLWNRTWSLAGNPSVSNIPFTCCKSKNMDSFPDDVNAYIDGLNNPNCPVSKVESYETGCYTTLRDLVSTYSTAVLGVALGVAALELILIIVACCISKKDEDIMV